MKWTRPSVTLAAMLAKLHTFSLLGIDALPVEVEVDVSPGALPKTVLVGLPEQAVNESTHRIERAMAGSGFVRPQDRVVINRATGSEGLAIFSSLAARIARISVHYNRTALFATSFIIHSTNLSGAIRNLQ
jgi:predicted ATPase with chaperone activity